MIKAIIIEDEKASARRLKRMLEKEHIEILSIPGSIQEAKKYLEEHPLPDLIFLDIHLSDGLGFEIITEAVSHIPIIFTTAFDQYAIEAFKLHSIDYLLKPVKEEDLKHALEKFHRFMPVTDWNRFLREWKEKEKNNFYKERFAVKKGVYVYIIPVEEIACFYTEDKITGLINKEGKNFYTDESLEQLEKQLNPKNFFRVNRQYLIAIDDIKQIIRYSNSRLKISLKSCPGKEMIVAREKVKKFLSVINR